MELGFRQALNGLGIAWSFLGHFDKAVNTFNKAIETATRIGDTVANATAWSNLGAVYEDLGRFTRAQTCYDNALGLEAIASNPRRAVEMQLNLASLKMLQKDLVGAEQCVDLAKERVKEAGLWWLVVDVLVSEADLYILGGNPESAWPLVEEAQANAKGRLYLLSDMTRFERLKRHHLWVNHGVDALALMRMEDLTKRCIRISGRREVLAFEEWVMSQEGIQIPEPGAAITDLEARRLGGVINRLDAIDAIYGGPR